MSDTNQTNQTTVSVTITPITRAPKNMAVAVILAVLFGPLGLLYASVTGGVVLLLAYLAALVLSFITLGLASFLYPFIWVVSIIWAILAVQGKDKTVIMQVKAGNFAEAVKTVVEPE